LVRSNIIKCKFCDMETIKRIFYGALLAVCVCIPILAIGNFFALYTDGWYLGAYLFINGLAAALLTWKSKWASLISYILVAFLLYPQFGFLWVVILGCTFGACLAI
jgi:hypothetical protein